MILAKIRRRRKQDVNGIVERDMSTLRNTRVVWFESLITSEKKVNIDK